MSQTKSRKIEEWIFSKDGIEIKVPVHLVGAVTRNNKTKPAHFAVHLDTHSIHETSENITALQRKVYKLLDGRVGIEWNNMLHVEVGGSVKQFPASGKSVNESIGTSISISIVPIKLARSSSGEKLHTDHREGKDHWREFDKARSQYVYPGWPDEHFSKKRGYGGVETSALVADTAENRAALNQLAADFQSLLDRLMVLLQPSRVQGTLAGAHGVLLLTEGDEARKQK